MPSLITDHRPDLKQIMLSLLTKRAGVPLWGGVHERPLLKHKKLNTSAIKDTSGRRCG